MSKGPAFDAAKYRNNPKLIAKYLNDALATDDPALTTRVIGNLARAHGMGAIAEEANVDRAGLYRSLSGENGSSLRDGFEGADRARRSVGSKAGRRLVKLMLKAKGNDRLFVAITPYDRHPQLF
jgi:probable addiction module antidote protein